MRSHQTLEVAAYAIGVLVCNERNRAKLTQEDLGRDVGIVQVDISHIENGRVPDRVGDDEIDRLFARLGMSRAPGHASFLKWWRDNAEAF